MSRFTFLLLLGVVVGAVTGLVAVMFRKMALWGEEHFFPLHGETDVLSAWWSLSALQRLLTPAIGGLICGVLLYKVGRYKAGHSIPTILHSLASGKFHFQKRLTIPPLMALVTLASGGSVGPEGPIAEIGSVTGSQIGGFARIPPSLVKTLIGAGVAAGIAAVFNAPIGGVFFAIEVILRNYRINSLIPILMAAVVASVISQAALGNNTAIIFPTTIDIPLVEMPYFFLLGMICGLFSLGYIYGLGWCHGLFEKIKIPLWIKPALGGLMVGMIGVFVPNVMGEGYDWIRRVIAGEESNWILLAALVAFKILATGFTLGSGNPGGSFAPAVFVGVMSGAAYGLILKGAGLVSDAAPYAIMGMAGLIGGALGAPITAMMITLRHAQDSSTMLLPVMTTVAICVFVMQLRKNVSVYTLGFLRLGIDLDKARDQDPLSLIRVRSVLHTDGFEELPASMPVFEAFERFKDSSLRWFVVRGDSGVFMGTVSLHEMRMAIAEKELAQLLVLSDITDSFQPRLDPELSLKQALVSFNSTDAEILPVFDLVDTQSRFVGFISRQDALNAYYECTAAQQDD